MQIDTFAGRSKKEPSLSTYYIILKIYAFCKVWLNFILEIKKKYTCETIQLFP